jgi:hypothetical protein
MLPVKNMLFGKLHCQKGFDLILFSNKVLWRVGIRAEHGRASTLSPSRSKARTFDLK